MRQSILLFAIVSLPLMLCAQDSLWLARTTGQLPFLEYANGTDRLGGAKMTYLDSGILLRIVDSFANNYKVQLSRLHAAYIAKASVILQTKVSSQIPSHIPFLSGSWKVFGDSASDYVLIRLPETLPYRSMQLLHPSRIAVDIFGISSNTNWITQLKSVKEIRNSWYEMIDDDVMRVYIELKHEQHWGYSIAYDSSRKTLQIRVRRQPEIPDIGHLRIAIDAGHGGENSGASGSRSGSLEKNYTLQLAKQLEEIFRTNGCKHIYMTRTKDTTLSMPERIMNLRQFDPDLLISVHLNSADSDTVQGVSTYYRYLGFRPLSTAILNRLLSLGLKEFGNVGAFNFALNGPTDYPNVLVELAFLSNKSDEKRIISPIFRKAAAQKIYLGTVDWLKQVK